MSRRTFRKTSMSGCASRRVINTTWSGATESVTRRIGRSRFSSIERSYEEVLLFAVLSCLEQERKLTNMASAITKRDVKLPSCPLTEGKFAFVLDNVMTPEECQRYIDLTEKKGFILATVNDGRGQVMATDVRNSSRCIWDSEEEAAKIWERVKAYVPEVFHDRRALGLNERLRFLRYDPGEYFKPHYDGSYTRENGERSLVTLQLYLNEGFEGGSTTFFNTARKDPVEVVPKTGSVLLFEHALLHEGSELVKGRKYAMRTDVMYSSDRVS